MDEPSHRRILFFGNLSDKVAGVTLAQKFR